jgi:hypothetical protein
MVAFWTGAATSGHNIRQAFLTSGVPALFAFAELPAELDHRNLAATRITFLLFWFTHSSFCLC